MKRLFTLKYQSGQLFTEGGLALYYQSKQDAKKRRDKLNEDVPAHATLKVSTGPDHWRAQK